MLDEALDYLKQPEGETRQHSLHYIEQVPVQIDTAYRRAFAALPDR